MHPKCEVDFQEPRRSHRPTREPVQPCKLFVIISSHWSRTLPRKASPFRRKRCCLRETTVQSKNIAIAMSVVLCIQTLGVRAFAAAEGDLKGHVVRSRDSQPIPGAPVQIKETGAKTSTDSQGAYAF